MNIREHIAVLATEVKNTNERLDRLMDLLTPRIEKWDAASTKVDILLKDRGSFFSPKRLGWTAILATLFETIVSRFVGK